MSTRASTLETSYRIDREATIVAVPERIDADSDRFEFIQSLDFTLIKEALTRPDSGLDWPVSKINYVEQQYKNWLHLVSTHVGSTLPPSEDVDVFWHAHMLDTRVYFRDCQRIFGHYGHHYPYFGTRDDADHARLGDAFETTRARHREEFGEDIYEFDAELDEEEWGTRWATDALAAELPYFLHLNHNAGNTMRSVIRANCTEDRMIDLMVQRGASADGGPLVPSSPDLEVVHAIAEIQARQLSVDYVACNLAVGLHDLLQRPVRYFALLREPVDRFRTTFYWAFHGAIDGGAAWRLIDDADRSVRRINELGVTYSFDNEQTRLISGSMAHELGRDDLERAKEHIDSGLVTVGTVDRFDESLERFARSFGWAETRYVRQNVGDKRDPTVVPETAVQEFREANEWDLRLHEWVVDTHLPSVTARPTG